MFKSSKFTFNKRTSLIVSYVCIFLSALPTRKREKVWIDNNFLKNEKVKNNTMENSISTCVQYRDRFITAPGFFEIYFYLARKNNCRQQLSKTSIWLVSTWGAKRKFALAPQTKSITKSIIEKNKVGWHQCVILFVEVSKVDEMFSAVYGASQKD